MKCLPHRSTYEEVQVAGDEAARKLLRHLLILDSRPQSVGILLLLRAHIPLLLSQSQEFRDSGNEPFVWFTDSRMVSAKEGLL